MKVAVFLRAVNVGGRKLVAADFKAALAQAGVGEVQTIGAAGSAVGTVAQSGAELESAIEAAVARGAGFASEAFVRSGPELEDVIAANPFAAFAAEDPGHLVFLFLRRDPEPAGVAAVAAKAPGRERVAGGPRGLYICYPDGIGTSKLTTAVIEKALGGEPGRGTGRNWNTVRRMAELTANG